MVGALRFFANNDRIVYDGPGLPDLASGYTLAMWIAVAQSTGTFATFARISAANATSGTFATTSTGTGGPTYATAGGVLTASAGMAIPTFYRYATTRLGAAGNLYTAQGLNGATELVSGVVSGADNPDQICFGGRSTGDGTEQLNGLVANVKLWPTVLDQAEIEQEWLSVPPLSDVAAYWPLASVDDLTDHSGNGLHLHLLAGGNSPATEVNGPPITAPSGGPGGAFLPFFP